jgi:hypothetical protein
LPVVWEDAARESLADVITAKECLRNRAGAIFTADRARDWDGGNKNIYTVLVHNRLEDC